ncbi:CatA-like O-acetyltransferase, family 2 [uncultured Dysosmobacter sp.]|uniref:CatA-like O-acetyltransferase, family 2 n=1 Tax=uncultured Dysosmobacter sp. TaxID=2591384 RepID=UPI002618C8F7|nr:CatA-like O-acetyltransferase, family 2 [uncultured Dysosmobacter sp.]
MREVDPRETGRADSWALYHSAPMPMVTLFKTLDITPLLRRKDQGYKLNMLLCWCVAQAAEATPEFYLLPVGEKLIQYDRLGVSVIVANQKGGLSSCDLPCSPDLETFSRTYLELTERVRQTCVDHELPGRMMVGTSSLVRYEIDGAANMYSGIFNNPFLIWSKYREENGRALLPLSFQFHHVQMDGLEACAFLERLQEAVRETGRA